MCNNLNKLQQFLLNYVENVLKDLYFVTGNIDFNTQHPAGFREGQASDTHSCDYIRSVPEHLRTTRAFYSTGINEFYQKYTEAYGIPVIGERLYLPEQVRLLPGVSVMIFNCEIKLVIVKYNSQE